MTRAINFDSNCHFMRVRAMEDCTMRGSFSAQERSEVRVMRIRIGACAMIFGAALTVASGSAWAHHALFGDYDTKSLITLRGTITKVEWKNPHGWIYIDVKTATGQAERWSIETGSPARMKRHGLHATDFQPGTEIIVGGFGARHGRRSVAGWIVTFPDRERTEDDTDASFTLGR
jgi:hypothetical protein